MLWPVRPLQPLLSARYRAPVASSVHVGPQASADHLRCSCFLTNASTRRRAPRVFAASPCEARSKHSFGLLGKVEPLACPRTGAWFLDRARAWPARRIPWL